VEALISDPVDALILDLLEWLGSHERSHAEVDERCGRAKPARGLQRL
jgi:hypothetical protein